MFVFGNKDKKENKEKVMNKEINRKVELAREILKRSGTVSQFYQSNYSINVENVGNDPMFLDIIISDGMSNGVFSAEEARKFLHPENYEMQKYNIEGYECFEMEVSGFGDINWVEKPHSGAPQTTKVTRWRNSQLPKEWAGHRFKVIRISEEASKNKFMKY